MRGYLLSLIRLSDYLVNHLVDFIKPFSALRAPSLILNFDFLKG
jgi:hypothetical protein